MIKFLGLYAMTVDHVGAVWLDRAVELTTLIGRLAFPIFAFLVGVNILRSRYPVRYIGYLFLAAVLSQPVVMAVLDRPVGLPLNVLFTLGLGAFLSWALFRSRDPISWAIFALPAAYLVSPFLEYSDVGVFLIVAIAWTYSLIRADDWLFFLPGAAALCLAYLVNGGSVQYGLVAVLTIVLCVLLQLRGGKPVLPFGDRSFFYFYYPLHLLLLFPLVL